MNSIATSASTTRPARSRNVLPLLLGAMLCTAAAPRTLHAETVQVNVNYHYGSLPGTTFGGFEKFDGTLGTLLEVRYQINAFFQYEVDVSPASALPQLLGVQASGSLIDTLGTSLSNLPLTQASAASFGGAFGSHISAGFGGPIIDAATTDPGDLAIFNDPTPPGDIWLNTFHTNALNFTPPGGYTASVVSQSADYDITLTYTYAPVPEPTTAALSVLSMGLLGCLRLRTRQA